jgi:DNA-binding beta-propeller fold protein YncE
MSIARFLIALCALWLSLCLSTCYAWREEYEFVLEWGTLGSDSGQFNGPRGMCTDKHGFVYVCDYNNQRVQKFDSLGNFALMFGSAGSGNGQFDGPVDVVVDDSGYIYVTDAFNSRVQKFDGLGAFALAWGDTGSAPGEFLIPEGIAVDRWGTVYVTDGGNHRVQRFDNQGNFLAQLIGPDSSRWDPMSIAVYQAKVYVCTAIPPHNIQQFDTSGLFIMEWNRYGSAPAENFQIGDMDTDEFGNVYAADFMLDRCQKFNGNGMFITLWGSQGSGPGQFDMPGCIAVDPTSGCVYVGEWGNNRVQKFRKVD